MSDATITYLVLAEVVVVFVWGRVPAAIAALAQTPEALVNRRSGIAEVVIPPRGAGGPARRRRSRTRRDEARRLLLRGTWAALDEQLEDPAVLVVDPPALVRRQAVPLGPGAERAIAVLAVMVVLLVTGAVPAAVAGLLAASAIVLLRLLGTDQAFRSISWTTVVLVGGMISLSTAMVETGAAEDLADELVTLVADAGPHALLVALFVLTAALGQLISNMATALIVIPIALSAAAEMDVSAKPVLMAVAVSAAAAFLTPVATPANLMMMGPGGYRFGDYWRLGLALFGVVSVLLVPVFWSL